MRGGWEWGLFAGEVGGEDVSQSLLELLMRRERFWLVFHGKKDTTCPVKLELR